MITNTPSFETNFQALPQHIQDKIKGYVPNVRIDRTSDAQFFNEVIQPKIQALPKEIQNHIKEYNPILIVDHTSRNKLFNELKLETEQKVGLYKESLILKGLHLCDELFETEKNYLLQKQELENELENLTSPKKSWYSPIPLLFTNALNNPTGKSEKALNVLYYTNQGAVEALEQLTSLFKFKKFIGHYDSSHTTKCNDIKLQMERIREQRTAEQTIYNACGGKEQFNNLKVFPDDDAIDLDYKLDYNEEAKGETVMRGLDWSGLPFITISLQKPGNVFLMLQQKGLLSETNTCSLKDYEDCKLLNTITVLKQDYNTPTKWTNSGVSGLMHSDEGDSVNEFGIKTGKTGVFFIEKKNEMKYSQYSTTYNLFPIVKELLTTGSCLYDAENPDRGMFKLVKQG